MAKLDWKEEVSIIGYKKSRREIFWNAIFVFLISVVYRIFMVVSKLPENFSKMSKEELDGFEIEFTLIEEILPIVLYLICFWLFSKALLKPTEEMVRAGSPGKAFLQRVYIVCGLVLLNSILQLIGIILIVL